LKDKHIFNRLPVAWEGIPFIVGSLAVTAILFMLHWAVLALVMTVVSAFMIYFFRDTDRPPIHDEAAIY
jgi:phosphatidylserine decarboxylase